MNEPALNYEEEFGRSPESAARDAIVAGTEIDRLLGCVDDLEKQLAEKKNIGMFRKAAIDTWLAVETARIEDKINWLVQQIRTFEGALNYGNKKSYPLPNGKVGRQSLPEGIDIVDPESAARFAEEHDIGEMRRHFGKSDLLAYMNSAGVIPEGCTRRASIDRFYIETPTGGRRS